MVARAPPFASPYRSYFIPPVILKGLKFKQRLRDRHHTHFGGIFNPRCGTRHSRCICEI